MKKEIQARIFQLKEELDYPYISIERKEKLSGRLERLEQLYSDLYGF